MSQDPVPLRAHNVLCLHGFRGEGYSAAFVARMREVHDRLRRAPDTLVRLLDGPDALCAPCPHLATGGCTLGGDGHEAHMRAQDRDVLRRLDLRAGAVLAWREVVRRVAARVTGRDLPAICTTCPWLPSGWCAEGLDALSSEEA